LLFEKALEADPANGEAKANRESALMLKANLDSDTANQQFRAGKHDEALATYQGIDLSVAGDECRFQIKNNMGAIYMQKQNVNDALVCFDAALAIRPLSVDTIHNKAMALKGVGRHSDALAAFDQCISAQPDFYSALCGRIETLNALSRFDDAIIQANAAIKCKPDDYRAYADRGFANLKKQNVDDAIVDFEQAQQHGSKNSSDLMKVYALAVSLKGDQLLNAHRYHEASEAYEKALSIGSSDRPPAGVLFNHSLALLHSGRKDEALDEMAHVVEVDPKFFPAWAAMGLSYLQAEKYPSAIYNLEEALKVKPEEIEVAYHLGVALLKNNNLQEAVDQFRKNLCIQPGHEASQKALSLVEASLAYQKAHAGPTPEEIAAKAEEARVAEEKRVEEERIVEEKRIEEERVEQEKIEVEKKRVEAEKKRMEEDQRKMEEEKKRVEEEMIAAKNAEEKRQAEERAAFVAAEELRIEQERFIEEEKKRVEVERQEAVRVEKERVLAEEHARKVEEAKKAEEEENKRIADEEEAKLQVQFSELVVNDDSATEVTKAFRSKTSEEGALMEAMGDVNSNEVFVQMDFDLAELTYPGPYPKGIRVDKREQYLPDALFQQMFKMTKTEFYELRKWRQMAKKKEVGLW
jgi:tetratricopeptide (TPR) repeat protein